MRRILILMCAFHISSCGAVSPMSTAVEDAPVDETVDFYHGDRVSDPYRTLEENNNSDTLAWLARQEQKAAAYFEGEPFTKIKDRLIGLEKQQTSAYAQPIWAGGRLFALKTQPPLSQPMLVAMPSWEHPEQEEVLVDPNIIDPGGALAIDWYVPSHNGRLVAVSMSKNDTEQGDLFIYNLETIATPKSARKAKGKKQAVEAVDASAPKKEPYPMIDDVISGVSHGIGGGSLVWTPDNKAFYYTKYSDDNGLSEQVYLHKLGDSPHRDTYELGRGFDPIARIQLEIETRSGRVIAKVQRGEGPEFAHHLRNPDGIWQVLSSFADPIVEIVFAPAGGMFLVSREDAKRGKVLFLPSPKVPLNQAKRLILETNEPIVAGISGHNALLVTPNRLYVKYQKAGTSELRVFSHDGKQLDIVQQRYSAVDVGLVSLEREEILIPVLSYNAPAAWFRYNGQLGAGSLTKTKLSPSGIEMDDIQIDEVSVLSKDGAKIPLTLVYQTGLQQTGNNPTVLMGNGGFGSFMTPDFTSFHRIWLESGGILAFAQVRGGGELGTDWHTAGRLTHKQNAFDDFYNCAQFLIDQKYTNKSKLAVRGEGAGALLAAVMLTQHPDTFQAVVAESGVYDLMRNEYTPGGEASVPEYGSNSDEAQYRAMVAYSPYHHVPKNTAFPAALFIAGRNNPKVAPWHSRKMAARLQAESKGSSPILFKSAPNAGQGNRLPFMQRLTDAAEILTFLSKSLNVDLQ